MRKLLIVIIPVLSLLFGGCNGGEDVIDKESPIIISQSIVTGATDVDVAPQAFYILFDREIELRNAGLITFDPAVAVEVVVNDKVLTINTLEAMAYEMYYTIRIGEGTVVDKLTGGENVTRVIEFQTIEMPYSPPVGKTYDLVTSNATTVTQHLYSKLWDNYGHYTLSGASMNDKWTSDDCDWVYRSTGKYPAIAMFNYSYLHTPYIDYTKNVSVIEEWWNSGGLVAATWFWDIPTKENSRKYTTLSSDTEATVRRMLTDGTWENEIFEADVQKMAEILLLLQQKGVTVLWRPLPCPSFVANEASWNGSYYWWGRDGGRYYKQLWQRMFERFKKCGVRNLIWIWTTLNDDTAYYPGDAYVDIVSTDLHNKNLDAIFSHKEVMESWFPQKMLWVTESRNVAKLGSQLDSEISWGAFVMGFDTLNDGSDSYLANSASAIWWSNAICDERVVTREMTKLYR